MYNHLRQPALTRCSMTRTVCWLGVALTLTQPSNSIGYLLEPHTVPHGLHIQSMPVANPSLRKDRCTYCAPTPRSREGNVKPLRNGNRSTRSSGIFHPEGLLLVTTGCSSPLHPSHDRAHRIATDCRSDYEWTKHRVTVHTLSSGR